jgi:hypothetical protein
LCVYADSPSLRVDYTEKKRLREKRKCPKSKFIRICLKEIFHREKKDEENLFLFLCGLTFPQGRLHREKKD